MHNIIILFGATDLNRGPFQEEAERIMTSLFQQTKFQKCHKYLEDSREDYADRFGQLKAAAISLCEIPEAQLHRVSIVHKGKGACIYLYLIHTISMKVL